MTVSTPTFDLLFDRLQRKQARLSNLDANVRRRQAKINSLLEQPSDPSRDRRLARLEGVQFAVGYRRNDIVDDIEFYTNTLPKDEITLTPEFTYDDVTGEVTYLQFEVTIQDSPYDDTFEFPTGKDKGLAYTTSGRGPKPGGGTRGWTRTVGTSNKPEPNSVTTFTRGSSAMTEQWNYGPQFTFSIWDNFGTKEAGFSDKELLYTEQFNPETYSPEIV